MANKTIIIITILLSLKLPTYAEKIIFTEYKKYDLNKVTSKQLYDFFKLMQWPLKKATLILRYRIEIKGFESIRELKYLKGIGKKFSNTFLQWFEINSQTTNLKKQQIDYTKFDINSCKFHKLMKLPLMNRFIARKIISLRKKKQGFKARWEILAIKAISPSYYSILKNYIYISKYKNSKFKFRLKSYLELNKTTLNKLNIKNKIELKLVEKYKLNLNYQTSFLQNNTNKKDKFISGNITYQNKQLYKFILGNYNLLIGEGLVFGSIFNMGDNHFNGLNSNKTVRIKSHTSFQSERMLQGIGADFNFKQKKLTLLLSLLKHPYNRSSNYSWFCKTVATTLPSRLQNIHKNNYQQEIISSVVWSTTKKNKTIGVGLTSFYYKTPILIFKNKENIFSGTSIGIANIFYNLQSNKLTLFGEVACSIYYRLIGFEQLSKRLLQFSPAFSGGLQIRAKKLRFSTHYNLIENNYISPLAKTQSSQNDRISILNKLSFKLQKNITISGFLNIHNLDIKDTNYGLSWIYKTIKYHLKTQFILDQNDDFLSKNFKLNFRYAPISDFHFTTTLNMEQELEFKKINNYLSLGIVYNNHKDIKIVCQWINFGESSNENDLFSYQYHLEGWSNIPERLTGVGQNIFLMAEYEFADSFKIGLLYNKKIFQKREQTRLNFNQKLAISFKLEF